MTGDLTKAKLYYDHEELDFAFRLSCENGHIEIAKWLYGLGINTKDNDNVFVWSCKNNRIEIAKWLYSLGLNINNNELALATTTKK